VKGDWENVFLLPSLLAGWVVGGQVRKRRKRECAGGLCSTPYRRERERGSDGTSSGLFHSISQASQVSYKLRVSPSPSLRTMVIPNANFPESGTPSTAQTKAMAALANTISRLAVPAVIAVGVAQASLYDVPGGHRAIIFDRFSGVREKVRSLLLCSR
jgi:hypothetical protein